MAILTYTDLLADARLHAQDDNTAGNALTDAQWAKLINEVYQTFASAFPEHFVIRGDSQTVYFTSGIGSWVPASAYGVGGVLTVTAAPAAAGTGYAVNDILSLTSTGTGGTVKVLTITGGGGTGPVGTVGLLTKGSGYTAATSNTSAVTGSGSSCTVTIATVSTVAGFGVRRVLAMRIGTVPLERMEPHRVYELQSYSSTAGTPTKYALIQDTSSSTMTILPNTYTVLLHPIPTNGVQTLVVDYEHYPIDLSASTDLPRGLGDAESRWIARIAAAKGARLNGKDPAFIAGILDGVDRDVLTRMNVKAGLLAPRQRPEETPV